MQTKAVFASAVFLLSLAACGGSTSPAVAPAARAASVPGDVPACENGGAVKIKERCAFAVPGDIIFDCQKARSPGTLKVYQPLFKDGANGNEIRFSRPARTDSGTAEFVALKEGGVTFGVYLTWIKWAYDSKKKACRIDLKGDNWIDLRNVTVTQ